MNWRSLGKNVLTLGIGYLIERVVAKKVPVKLTEILSDMARGHVDKIPPELKKAMDALLDAQFRDSMAKIEELGKKMEASLAKHERAQKRLRK